MSIPGDRLLQLRVLTSPEPWETLILPVDSFPMTEPRLGQVREFLKRFTDIVSRQGDLSPEVFLQFWRLRNGDAASRYSANAAKWLSDLGLGVWPDRRPPAMWTQETFMDACAADEPPVMMHKLFRITAPGKAQQARDVMFGCGTVLQILTRGDSQAMLARTREVLLKPIEDTSFRSFRFYLPLLEGKTLATATALQLESWLGGATLYIRESVEDHGVLIVSSEPLGPILQTLGRFEQGVASGEWHVAPFEEDRR